MISLFLDLETAPTQNAEAKSAIFNKPEFATRDLSDVGEIKPDGRIGKGDAHAAARDASVVEKTAAARLKIQSDNNDKWFAANKAYRDTALDGWAGHIAMIGAAAYEHPPIVIPAFDIDQAFVNADGMESVGKFPPETPGYTGAYFDIKGLGSAELETRAINKLFRQVADMLDLDMRTTGRDGRIEIVGHNVRRFDVLFLWQRCIVLCIQVPNWLAAARFESKYIREGACVVDTMEVCGTTKGTPFGPGLDRVCKALGIPGKDGMDGSQVYDALMDGRAGVVMDYCAGDVSRVRSVFRRILGQEPLACDLPVPPQAAPAHSVAA